MKFKANYYIDMNSFLEDNINNKQQFLLFVASKTCIQINQFYQFHSPIVGAIFPKILYNHQLYDSGLIAFEFDNSVALNFIKNIKEYNFTQENYASFQSVLTIVNGFSVYNETFLSLLYESVDLNTNIIGGGAGSLKKNDSAVLFDNSGFYVHSAIVLLFDVAMNIGVKHGWEYLKGPYLVTKSQNNILESLDYKNATEVYKKIIEDMTHLKLNHDNFYDIAQAYPLGVVKFDEQLVVRDPFSFEDEGIVLVGEIPQNSVINILHGKKDNLIQSAGEAAYEASKDDSNFMLMFDCVSRMVFLEDRFSEELLEVQEKTQVENMVGAITVGEIANKGNRYINFFNKTCVIGGLCH